MFSRSRTPRGQELAKGVTRPPLVTAQQETPPPAQAVRSESAEPRTLAERYEARIADLEQRIATYVNRDQNAHTHMISQAEDIATRDRRIVRLEEDKRKDAERLAVKDGRIKDLETTVSELTWAAAERQARHRAELADQAERFGSLGQEVVRLKAQVAAATLRAMDAPPGVDQTPTAPLPLVGVVVDGPGRRRARVSDDLLAEGWAARTSAP